MMLQTNSNELFRTDDLDYIRIGLVLACLQLSISEASLKMMGELEVAKTHADLRERLDGIAKHIAAHSNAVAPNCGQCDGFGKCPHCKGTGGANFTDDCEYCNASGKCGGCYGSGLKVNHNETEVFQTETQYDRFPKQAA